MFLTREQACARKAAILLARFAVQMPKWPIYFPTRADLTTAKAGGNEWGRYAEYPQKGPGMNLNSDATGPWAIWYYEDILAGMPLARAYDLIHDSGEMQRLGALQVAGLHQAGFQLVEFFLHGHLHVINYDTNIALLYTHLERCWKKSNRSRRGLNPPAVGAKPASAGLTY